MDVGATTFLKNGQRICNEIHNEIFSDVRVVAIVMCCTRLLGSGVVIYICAENGGAIIA